MMALFPSSIIVGVLGIVFDKKKALAIATTVTAVVLAMVLVGFIALAAFCG